MAKLNAKQLAKYAAIRDKAPWLPSEPAPVTIRAQIKDLERCAAVARKALAIIAPPQKAPTMGKNDGLGK